MIVSIAAGVLANKRWIYGQIYPFLGLLSLFSVFIAMADPALIPLPMFEGGGSPKWYWYGSDVIFCIYRVLEMQKQAPSKKKYGNNAEKYTESKITRRIKI